MFTFKQYADKTGRKSFWNNFHNSFDAVLFSSEEVSGSRGFFDVDEVFLSSSISVVSQI